MSRNCGEQEDWRVGDILRGECLCDSSKIIDFKYLGGARFRGSDGCIQYTSFHLGTSPQDVVSMFGIQYRSAYTKWRRVPKYEAASLNASRIRDGSVDASSWPAQYSMDYEFGDTIKVRGFEYEIKHYSGSSTQGIHLEKKEPTKPKKIITCEYALRHSHFGSNQFFEVRFRVSKDAPKIHDGSSIRLLIIATNWIGSTHYNSNYICLASDAIGKWSDPIIVPRNIRDQLLSICTKVGRVLTEEVNKDVSV